MKQQKYKWNWTCIRQKKSFFLCCNTTKVNIASLYFHFKPPTYVLAYSINTHHQPPTKLITHTSNHKFAFQMGTVGRLVHYSVDAVLISTVLAGIRRSYGLKFKSSRLEGSDFHNLMVRYLDVGEWMMDTSYLLLSHSQYFEQESNKSRWTEHPHVLLPIFLNSKLH